MAQVPQLPVNDRIYLDMTIQLPNYLNRRVGPRPMPDLDIGVSSVNITAHDLIKTVYFNMLSLTAKNGSINLGVSYLQKFQIKTQHGICSHRAYKLSVSHSTPMVIL
jgi:hypothetical protein